MHERSIAGIKPKPPRELEYTSFIYRIFGGRIRSQIKCTECKYESNTFDPFLDLSLEITNARSVQRALQHFTEKEVLDGANKYRCPNQKHPVRAFKQMTIDVAPNVLIIQLKRFQFSFSGRKISKPVDFSDTLDLSPFMSQRPKTPAIYDLFGVLVHQGHSMHSGHYFCYIKGAGGSGGNEWHKFDDTRVHPTSSRNVLGQQPYLLFYIRRQTKSVINGLPANPEDIKRAVIAQGTKQGIHEIYNNSVKSNSNADLLSQNGIHMDKNPMKRKSSQTNGAHGKILENRTKNTRLEHEIAESIGFHQRNKIIKYHNDQNGVNDTSDCSTSDAENNATKEDCDNVGNGSTDLDHDQSYLR